MPLTLFIQTGMVLAAVYSCTNTHSVLYQPFMERLGLHQLPSIAVIDKEKVFVELISILTVTA